MRKQIKSITLRIGALIPSLIWLAKTIIIVEEVEIFMCLGTVVSEMSTFTIDFTSHV